MSVSIVESGTPEHAWRQWRGLAGLRPLSLERCPGALVVAPHPDDEVLGAGGTLAELHERGVDVSILALTDGEASHPDAPIDPSELGRRRAAETRQAMIVLLGEEAAITRLGLPDGGLADREETIECVLEQILEPGIWCFAPFRQDGHPDHEAATRAAMRACERRGARLVEYPIWLWHWTQPGAGGLPWERARQVRLPPGTQARKARATREFASQIAPLTDGAGGEPILPRSVLEHFERPFEVFFA